MLIPIQLDYVVDRIRRDDREVERRALKQLAGVSLEGDEARALWPRILEHKWYMSERMGRDVGLRVAAVDFFEYVQPLPRSGADAMRAPLADPVAWLERVLSQFTRALGAIVGISLG